MQRMMAMAIAVWAVGFAPLALTSAEETSAKTGSEYDALVAAFTKAQGDYRQVYSRAKTQQERQQALDKAPQAADFADGFLKLAKSRPDTPAALQALIWVAINVRHGKPLAEACQILTSKYIDDEGLVGVTGGSAKFSPCAARSTLLRTLLDNSPHRKVKTAACLTLAQLIGAEARMAPMVKQNGDRYIPIYGEQLVARLKQADATLLKADAEKLFARAVHEFGDADTLFSVLQFSSGPSQQAALEILLRDHSQDAQFLSRIKSFALRGGVSPSMEKLLGILIKAELGRGVEGAAVLALAKTRKGQADRANQFKQLTPERLELYENAYGADYVARLQAADATTLLAEAEQLFQRVVDEFADVNGDLVLNGRTLPRGTLGEQAAPALFEMNNLSVGKVAPEIAAEDIGGVDFKLSDYRGKVVMLDFWGHW